MFISNYWLNNTMQPNLEILKKLINLTLLLFLNIHAFILIFLLITGIWPFVRKPIIVLIFSNLFQKLSKLITLHCVPVSISKIESQIFSRQHGIPIIVNGRFYVKSTYFDPRYHQATIVSFKDHPVYKFSQIISLL